MIEVLELKFQFESPDGIYACGYSDSDYNDEVYPENIALMQFTGLLDKNGKEIYESDWLKDDQGIIYQAKFGKLPLDKSGDCVCTYPAFYAEGRDRSAWNECNEIAEWMEIIGNIYENPELISQQ